MEEEEDPDITAMMGFGSFGGTKKRKFDQTNSPKSRMDASGANSTQLGVRIKPDLEEEHQELHDTNGTTIHNGPTNDAQPQSHAPSSKAKGKRNQQEAAGLASFLARAQTLPETPHNAEESAMPSTQNESVQNLHAATFSYGGPSISETELYALRRGIKDDAGDTAYFLPSFVEDPWENLLQQRR
ncbi:hypothetical protein K505DRAFT_321142 [Melanomma pulvis-pyrius CBS 109.77]|uniref:Uncharacterized protein n=1 Tax=Melanomma pulvis-pyrius CBS 109.77 TaxID=1314802 RepID=A0A6A6XTS3_9PLEO|nr:hypothetical protein K505DRAFT_321142 [Melanomma pulvis-pyrius CBS 109.77]